VGFEFAGVFVDGDDGNDDAVLREMAAVADDDFFDLFERAGIDEDAAGGDGIAAEGAVFGELDGLAIFDKKNFFGNDAELVGERGVAEEMAVFAVDGDEILGLDEL
jgi:hypothetical protein